MSKTHLYNAGKTEGDKVVIGGWFYMVTTHGIPMDVVVDQLNQLGYMPDWLDFYFTAISEGWNPKRTIGRLTLVVADVYGQDFQEKWLERFNLKLKELEELNGQREECSGDTN